MLPAIARPTRALPLPLLLTALLAACDEKPTYDPADWKAAPLLPGVTKDDFLLGAATAAYQVEGGLDAITDWGEFETRVHPADHPTKANKPAIVDQRPAGRAADSWNLWQQDIDALKRLGANGYRMGLDWARIEPTEGNYDAAAIARYRQILQALRDANIEPMVTVYHFVLPRWVADKATAKATDAKKGLGAWENEETVALATKLATKAAQEFGDLVDLWITVNEPNVLTTFGYLTGVWAPGFYGDQNRMVTAFTNVMKAHAGMAKAIHDTDTTSARGNGRKAAETGIAHHMRFFESASWGTLDNFISGVTDSYFNDTVLIANTDGVVRVNLPPVIQVEVPIENLKGSFDFIGLNYYGRDFVRADLTDASLSKQFVPKDRPKNALGWDIYPEGLERLLVRLKNYGLPIYITENGAADWKGGIRADALRSHLYAIKRAMDQGADVRGYMHWSLIDNYEWAEGYTAPFGLFTIDFSNDPTLARKPTCAINVFREAARNLGLTPEGADGPTCPE